MYMYLKHTTSNIFTYKHYIISMQYPVLQRAEITPRIVWFIKVHL